MNAEPMFEFYIGIDYSGAETAKSGLRALRIYTADPNTPPTEVQLSGRRWTRRAVAEWLQTQLSGDRTTLVGIDHAFAFPIQYFERNDAPRDWTAFLKDFSITGRPITITRMSISSATGLRATERLVPATRVGGD